MKFRHAIVLGASSGIGAEIARQLIAEGTRVAVVARRLERLQELGAQAAYAHDVRTLDEIPELFQKITQDLGGLDLIVYATGVMPSVEWTEFDFEKDRAIMETNLIGAMAWLDLAALRFQGTKSGCIAAIGSVAGERGRGGQPAYNTSKAALATYLESLRNRLDRLGVSVVLIKPGPTETEMTQGLGWKGMDSAEDVAGFTLSKLGKSGEHFVQLKHRVMFAVIRNIPSSIFRRMKI